MNLNAPFILIPWDYWFFSESLVGRDRVSNFKLENHTVVIPYEMSEDFDIMTHVGVNQIVSEDHKRLIRMEFISEKDLKRFDSDKQAYEMIKYTLVGRSITASRKQIQFWLFGSRDLMEAFAEYFDDGEMEYLSPNKNYSDENPSKIYQIRMEACSHRAKFLGIKVPQD